MDPNNPFYRQVALLVQLLPIVGTQRCFALKGGTAINLFVRDLPRLSVDIDLAYLPPNNREAALAEIDAALKAIATEVERRFPGCQINAQPDRDTNSLLKLTISANEAVVKIEVTPVLRGAVFDPELRVVRPSVEKEFGFAELQLLNFADLYAGKLCAALDRQHPRDLYDVHLLLENEGLSDELMQAFLVYLIGHNRPMAELLAPRLKPISDAYEAEFAEMVFEEVGVATLEATFHRLVESIHTRMSDDDRAFLLSIKRGEPKWAHLRLPHIEELPSVRWKLLNLDRMAADKRSEAVGNLENVLQVG
ncbi:nucleotidyl transferase AbiEii/AbiGii toxin family protein [Sedimenticola sp.]|uniref:nucleotidyl transferase AbiEii/AbiGii toxin family protein n=1 Tax=Sedimenticola sp. TaxID=1940285 RepID=UPI003D123A30